MKVSADSPDLVCDFFHGASDLLWLVADETQGGFGDLLFADRYRQLSVRLGRGCWFSILGFGWLGF